MDIVAETLSTHILRTGNVTVRGQDIREWLESKLSVSVQFAGVFDRLEDAPKRNGYLVIVKGKDYIYSASDGKWHELGDEGQIGALETAVAGLAEDVRELSSRALSSSAVWGRLSGELSDQTDLYSTLTEMSGAISSSGLSGLSELSAEVGLMRGSYLSAVEINGTVAEISCNRAAFVGVVFDCGDSDEP